MDNLTDEQIDAIEARARTGEVTTGEVIFLAVESRKVLAGASRLRNERAAWLLERDAAATEAERDRYLKALRLIAARKTPVVSHDPYTVRLDADRYALRVLDDA